MTDFERTCEMAKQIGELQAYVMHAKEIIEKAEFEKHTFTQIQKDVWLDSVSKLKMGVCT